MKRRRFGSHQFFTGGVDNSRMNGMGAAIQISKLKQGRGELLGKLHPIDIQHQLMAQINLELWLEFYADIDIAGIIPNRLIVGRRGYLDLLVAWERLLLGLYGGRRGLWRWMSLSLGELDLFRTWMRLVRVDNIPLGIDSLIHLRR
jgi:hypothetical protein